MSFYSFRRHFIGCFYKLLESGEVLLKYYQAFLGCDGKTMSPLLLDSLRGLPAVMSLLGWVIESLLKALNAPAITSISFSLSIIGGACLPLFWRLCRLAGSGGMREGSSTSKVAIRWKTLLGSILRVEKRLWSWSILPLNTILCLSIGMAVFYWINLCSPLESSFSELRRFPEA